MDEYAPPQIPKRARDAHKGVFGRVLILAGSPRMTGAALLCGGGALKAGAGLVTLGIPARIHPWIATRVTCEMTLPLADTAGGAFSWKAAEAALEFLAGADAFALGPGLGTDADTRDFVRDVTRRAPCPGVVDADGLNTLTGQLEALRQAPAPRILTPHPGECARLLGTTIEEVQADRPGAARRLARETGAVVALKGRGTVVDDGARVFVNDTGNPGMASGGTGDVLTGVAAGLLAGGMAPFDAAALAVRIHGRAGDLAARRVGEVSLTAADLLQSLADAVREASEA